MPINDLHYDFGVVEFIKNITEYLTDCHVFSETAPKQMGETEKINFELGKLRALRYEVDKYLKELDTRYLPSIEERLEELELRRKSNDLGTVISRSIESLIANKEN